MVVDTGDVSQLERASKSVVHTGEAAPRQPSRAGEGMWDGAWRSMLGRRHGTTRGRGALGVPLTNS